MKTLSFNTILFKLFCLYAFLLPFEYILEVYLGIDTQLKPYRVVSLIIITLFLVRTMRYGLVLTKDIREDVFLYAIFLYGILVSLFHIITGPFSMRHFNNDLFQTGLYLTTYFVFKTLNLSRAQLMRLFNFFLVGMTLNAFYVFYNFRILSNFGRDAGFMDNPNYLALGLVAAIVYTLLKLGNFPSKIRGVGLLVLITLLIYVFNIAGSRTGLVLFLVSLLLLFYFSTLRNKLILLLIGSLVSLIIFFPKTEQLTTDNPLVLSKRVNKTLESEEEDIRFIIWGVTFQGLEERGYWGMGIGQYKADFSILFNKETNEDILERVNRGYHFSTHNDLLALLTDFGLPGVFFYVIFLFLVFLRLIRETFTYRVGGTIPLLLKLNFIVFFCLFIFGLAAENFQNQLFWFLLMFSTKSKSENDKLLS